MAVGVGSTDWRTLYEYKMEEYQEREQAVGQRLRRMAAQCAELKNSRTMQVSLCAAYACLRLDVLSWTCSHMKFFLK